jgi:hypothetical protein
MNVMTSESSIKQRIFVIRGVQVMIDSDLAELYKVPTKRLNEQVKRNIGRFPNDFMFQLSSYELENLRSQFATTKLNFIESNNEYGGRRYLPYVFTEQGVAALSGILKSKTAIEINLQIIRTFVSMRKFISSNAQIFQRLDRVELKQLEHNHKFEKVFKAIEDKSIKPSKGIFFDGQIFDAYKFVSGLVKSAKKSIVLIDNYVDESVLVLFSKCKDVEIIVYTKNLNKKLELDVNKFNSQYSNLIIRKFNKSHDRFMIIDNKEVYHFGASLKDLGKKWFAFSKFDKKAVEMLDRLK